MQRIDGPTVSAILPAPQAAGVGAAAPGYFTGGDPIAGTPPTTLTADWANMVQEELLAVVLAAGLQPDKANLGQLLAAMRLMFLGAGGSNIHGTWERRPTTVMEQWGRAIGPFGEGEQAITFPTPFPVQCDNVQVTAINTTGDVTRDMWGEVVSWSTTGAVILLNTDQTTAVTCDAFFWRAIGT